MAAILSLVSAPALGQAPQGIRPAIPTGPAPRTADGKPDLSGLWRPQPNFTVDLSKGLKPGSEISMLPWAAKVTAERMSKDDDRGRTRRVVIRPERAPEHWLLLEQIEGVG